MASSPLASPAALSSSSSSSGASGAAAEPVEGDSFEQVFLPHRLLSGLLPAALLELYAFWQNEPDDSIDGYCNEASKGNSGFNGGWGA